MRACFELIKINLKRELDSPFLSDLKCTYLIQKIKLLTSHNVGDGRGKEIFHNIL